MGRGLIYSGVDSPRTVPPACEALSGEDRQGLPLPDHPVVPADSRGVLFDNRCLICRDTVSDSRRSCVHADELRHVPVRTKQRSAGAASGDAFGRHEPVGHGLDHPDRRCFFSDHSARRNRLLHAGGRAIVACVGIHGQRATGRDRTGKTKHRRCHACAADQWNAVRDSEVARHRPRPLRRAQLVQDRPQAFVAVGIGRRTTLAPACRPASRRGPI